VRGRGSGKLRGAGSIGDTRKRPTGREGSRRRRCAAAAVLLLQCCCVGEGKGGVVGSGGYLPATAAHSLSVGASGE
jgi:hypothetical protein